MPTHETLTDQWLATVLSEMGDCHEEVGETLRKAQIKGRQGDLYDCPIARCIASRVREHLPSGSMTVTVCWCVAVSGDDWEITADVPEPVSEFITAFDNAESDNDLYADLVAASEPWAILPVIASTRCPVATRPRPWAARPISEFLQVSDQEGTRRPLRLRMGEMTMPLLEAEIEVHDIDDVTFTVNTSAFMDAIGPVDRELEDAVNQVLDAFVTDHAYFYSECWYNLSAERDSRRVLQTALAAAVGLDVDEVSAEYGFSTCNWENNLEADFGGTLWNTAEGRRFLTVESGDLGRMDAAVQVRIVECEEPEYVIASCSSQVQLGCTRCDFATDTGLVRVDWPELTRCDEDGSTVEGLWCPRCGAPLVAEVWI